MIIYSRQLLIRKLVVCFKKYLNKITIVSILSSGIIQNLKHHYVLALKLTEMYSA